MDAALREQEAQGGADATDRLEVRFAARPERLVQGLACDAGFLGNL